MGYPNLKWGMICYTETLSYLLEYTPMDIVAFIQKVWLISQNHISHTVADIYYFRSEFISNLVVFPKGPHLTIGFKESLFQNHHMRFCTYISRPITIFLLYSCITLEWTNATELYLECDNLVQYILSIKMY